MSIVQRNALRAFEEELPLATCSTPMPRPRRCSMPLRSTASSTWTTRSATPGVAFDRLEAAHV